jgi:putative N-acetylmannosamine-6-phosphate epimerase
MNRDYILNAFLNRVRGGLIVSCQALDDEPLHGSPIMARMALAAQQGGAVGIRANGPDDIRAIRHAVPLPIIGLYKEGKEGVYITPTFDHARAVAQAGADVIAIDATERPRPGGETLAELIQRIHAELNRPIMADVSTLAEAQAAAAYGADLVGPTLAGYTPYSPPADDPLILLRAIAAASPVPVIAEGRISTPEQARAALATGALAVVVGSAITRPQWITARFAQALTGGHGAG